MPLTQEDIRRCIFVEEIYVYDSQYLLTKITEDSPCEVKLIANRTITDINSCDIRIVTTHPNHWSKSLDAYKLYFCVLNPEKIKIECDQQKIEVSITGSGMIKLEENCRIQAKEFSYLTPKTRTFVLAEVIATTVDLKPLTNLLNVINFNENMTIEELEAMQTPDIELKLESTKLEEIIKRAEYIMSQGDHTFTQIKNYLIEYLPYIYTALGVFLLIIIYKNYLHKFCFILK